MSHLQRKLLTFLATCLTLVLLPAANAVAGGQAPPEPNNNFTMEGIERGCFPNDTSGGQEFTANVLITHEEGKTLQVTATTETVEGEEVAYVGETFVKSEEVHVGIRMHAIRNSTNQKGLLYIGPWAFATFNFYEPGYYSYKVGTGKGNNQFELCSELPGDHPPVIKGVIPATTQSGKAILINVLEHVSDPDGDALEVIGISQPRLERGWSNDPNNGRVFIEDNQVRYTPPARTRDYQVSFAYFVSDGKKGWSEGFVIVEVLEGNTTPPKLPTVGESIPQENKPVIREVFIQEGNTPETVATKTGNQLPKKGGAPYDLTLGKKAHISHNTVSVILTCRESIECAGILNLKLGKRIVGAQKYAITAGRWIVRIKLTKAVARSITRTKGRKLSIVASATCCRKTTVALEI